MCSSNASSSSSFPTTLPYDEKKRKSESDYKSFHETCGWNNLMTSSTYKWKVSLYLGDHVLDLDLVANLRFLSDKWGPIKLTSTKARNIPDCTGHFKSLAATTVTGRHETDQVESQQPIIWNSDACSKFADSFLSRYLRCIKARSGLVHQQCTNSASPASSYSANSSESLHISGALAEYSPSATVVTNPSMALLTWEKGVASFSFSSSLSMKRETNLWRWLCVLQCPGEWTDPLGRWLRRHFLLRRWAVLRIPSNKNIRMKRLIKLENRLENQVLSQTRKTRRQRKKCWKLETLISKRNK